MTWYKIDDRGWHRQISIGYNKLRWCLDPSRSPAKRLASGGARVPRVLWGLGGRGGPMGLG